MSGYDVVGDVHGQLAKLTGLLDVLGYVRTDGRWSHPQQRRLVFVGDVIDRGAHQRATLQLVRSVIDDGVARMVMGNHEWNAISYATPHRDEPERHLRSRTAHHVRQHEAFLADIDLDGDEHRSIVAWFRSLPLWLDLGGVRVVHACWSPDDIEVLTAHLVDGAVTDELLHLGNDRVSREYRAIEHVLKGPELPLEPALAYRDKDGAVRHHARYAWWSTGPMTLRERAQAMPGMTGADGSPHPGFDDRAVDPPVAAPEPNAGPIIVGHYWFTGTPTVLSDRVACVDYSAGKDGPLVAYRWSGEPTLTNDRFVSFA